jgi:hypothetical protein
MMPLHSASQPDTLLSRLQQANCLLRFCCAGAVIASLPLLSLRWTSCCLLCNKQTAHVVFVLCWHLTCRPAVALTALDKLLSPSDEVPAAGGPEASQLKRKLLQQLGWQHWKAYDEAWALVKFPAKLPPL